MKGSDLTELVQRHLQLFDELLEAYRNAARQAGDTTEQLEDVTAAYRKTVEQHLQTFALLCHALRAMRTVSPN
ncbi:MAG TPA: hypothetical protein VM223_09180 [Planctomycetota bacterium]|nr:hypothetical protein [Planctomycetota bacterium]